MFLLVINALLHIFTHSHKFTKGKPRTKIKPSITCSLHGKKSHTRKYEGVPINPKGAHVAKAHQMHQITSRLQFISNVHNTRPTINLIISTLHQAHHTRPTNQMKIGPQFHHLLSMFTMYQIANI